MKEGIIRSQVLKHKSLFKVWVFKIMQAVPEWIFLWAVRLDFEEKDLPQASQLCLASPECI